MSGLIWMTLLLAVEVRLSPLYYQSWLYATPWRPLTGQQTPLDLQQLSLGYTGPQTFPDQARAQTSARTIRLPSLVNGLFRPAATKGQFTLPFRPSPFAGYTNDEEKVQQQQQKQHQLNPPPQQQQQQFEPPFYAPGQPQAEKPSTQSVPQQPEQHYVYLLTGNVCKCERS